MIPFWKKTDKHSKPQSAQKRRQNAKPAVPRTAQQSIPMQRMFEDGTCRVKPNYYTRTIQYQDINYQLAQQEGKVSRGRAIPFRLPYWATAALRPPASSRQTVRQAGTSMFSAVCRALARHRPPSTGHRISQSRRAGSAGRRAFSAPNARTASPR